jgi:hypothetical protein
MFCAVALCGIGDGGWSQQSPKPKPEITISVTPTKNPNVFTIALHNIGQRGLSVVLGGGCTRSHSDITAVTYRLMNEGLVDIDFQELGRPCAGNYSFTVADLAPSESYSYDMYLDDTTLAVDEGLMHAVNAGKAFYVLWAVVDGQKGIEENDWGKDSMKEFGKFPLWRGKAASACIPFPSPTSLDWQGFVARGGSLGNMSCHAE